MEVRDLWPDSIVAVGALREGHPIIRGLRQIEGGLYNYANKIVLVSDDSRDILAKRGFESRKLAVHKNGANLSMFNPRDQDTSLRRRLGWRLTRGRGQARPGAFASPSKP